jgi:hypothetical protein
MQFLNDRKHRPSFLFEPMDLNLWVFCFSEPEVWAAEDSHPPLITTVQVNGCMAVVIALKGPNEIAQGNALGNSTKNQVLKGRKVLFAGHRAPSGLF